MDARFQKDIYKRLDIDPTTLHLKYKSLIGTRHIIQYQNPDYVFTMSKTFKPKILCFGVTNRCEDGKFILFLDYDKIYKELMYKNLNNLLKQFPKSFNNFYIAKTEPETILEDGKTKGSYHVINFIKHYKFQINEFLKICDVDPFFLAIPQKTAHKCHVLRFVEKLWKHNGTEQKQRPEFLELYPKQFLKKSQLESSKAHYKLFKHEWDFKDDYYAWHKFDKLNHVEIHRYSTVKNEG